MAGLGSGGDKGTSGFYVLSKTLYELFHWLIRTLA